MQNVLSACEKVYTWHKRPRVCAATDHVAEHATPGSNRTDSDKSEVSGCPRGLENCNLCNGMLSTY